MATLKELYETESKELSKNPSRVSQLLDGIKGYKPSPDSIESQLAAWFSVTNTLLNLDENRYKVISAMTPDQFQNFSRRSLFQHTGTGLGSIALASLLQEDLLGRTSVGMHHPAKAKNVIYFHFVGAPSHLDLFEWKPELQKRDGQLCPDEFFKGKRLAFIRKQPKLLGTQKSEKFKFQRCGQSGAYISSLLPELQKKQTSYVSFARCKRIISIMHPLSSSFHWFRPIWSS